MAVTWPGATSAGISCGIKRSGRPDLGLLVFDEPVEWAGVFTRNAAAAPPVRWCRRARGERVRALVVNSGNANACTGEHGELAAGRTAATAASALGCEVSQILLASTGPIGIQLPVDKITGAIPRALGHLSADGGSFASSILTTDKREKTVVQHVGDGSIVGVAKGGAMVAPNMATMLAFLVTDVPLDAPALQEALTVAVDKTFNRLSIDGCESTNDSVFLFSTGKAASADPGLFTKALTESCASLAEQMARDAEGGSKLVRIRITGAASEDAAAAVGRAIASSALWRAAIHGADANWGRILAAAGSVDRDLDLSSVTVSLGDTLVFRTGAPVVAPTAPHPALAGDEVVIRCDLGVGEAAAEVLTVDLSPEYVTLNAFGTT